VRLAIATSYRHNAERHRVLQLRRRLLALLTSGSEKIIAILSLFFGRAIELAFVAESELQTHLTAAVLIIA